ncbi:hypothetical protein INU60_004910 [Salmonella enterica]|nr:hypothetical protein [Salmonella enterica]
MISSGGTSSRLDIAGPLLTESSEKKGFVDGVRFLAELTAAAIAAANSGDGGL